jgi:hypothetical protein
VLCDKRMGKEGGDVGMRLSGQSETLALCVWVVLSFLLGISKSISISLSISLPIYLSICFVILLF